MTLSKPVTIVGCRLLLGAVEPTLMFADEAQYIHDELGPFTQAIDGQGNI
jgi:hypothetical protein